jgi:hypothetical protein
MAAHCAHEMNYMHTFLTLAAFAFAFALCVTDGFCTSTQVHLHHKDLTGPSDCITLQANQPVLAACITLALYECVRAAKSDVHNHVSVYKWPRMFGNAAGMWGSVKRTHSAFDGRVINVEAPKAKAADFEPRPARHAGVFSRAGRSIFTVPYILAHRRVDTPSHRQATSARSPQNMPPLMMNRNRCPHWPTRTVRMQSLAGECVCQKIITSNIRNIPELCNFPRNSISIFFPGCQGRRAGGVGMPLAHKIKGRELIDEVSRPKRIENAAMREVRGPCCTRACAIR